MVRLNMNQEVEIMAVSIEQMRAMTLQSTDFVVSICPAIRAYQEDVTPQNVILHKQFVSDAFDDITYPIEGYGLMRKDQAVHFIIGVENALQARTKRIIVHCAAGISRSPAVAIALSLIFNLHPSAYELINQHLAFNEHVLITMLNAWRKLAVERSLMQKIWPTFDIWLTSN